MYSFSWKNTFFRSKVAVSFVEWGSRFYNFLKSHGFAPSKWFWKYVKTCKNAWENTLKLKRTTFKCPKWEGFCEKVIKVKILYQSVFAWETFFIFEKTRCKTSILRASSEKRFPLMNRNMVSEGHSAFVHEFKNIGKHQIGWV